MSKPKCAWHECERDARRTWCDYHVPRSAEETWPHVRGKTILYGIREKNGRYVVLGLFRSREQADAFRVELRLEQGWHALILGSDEHALSQADHRQAVDRYIDNLEQGELPMAASRKTTKKTTAKTRKPHPAGSKLTAPCACGCGDMAPAGKDFLHGHHAKLRGNLVDAYKRATNAVERKRIEKEFRERGWGAWFEKMCATLEASNVVPIAKARSARRKTAAKKKTRTRAR